MAPHGTASAPHIVTRPPDRHSRESGNPGEAGRGIRRVAPPYPWIPAFAGMTIWGLGMTIWGLGMTIWGLGMTVWGLGMTVWGLAVTT